MPFMITISFGGAVAFIIISFYIIVFVIPSAIRAGYEKFMKWRATGYCKHDFDLYSTHSFGNYADFKCTKCGEDRVLRL